jgi:hypothetical protein
MFINPVPANMISFPPENHELWYSCAIRFCVYGAESNSQHAAFLFMDYVTIKFSRRPVISTR